MGKHRITARVTRNITSERQRRYIISRHRRRHHFQESESMCQNRKSIFFIPHCHEKSTCFGKCFFQRYPSTARIGDMRSAGDIGLHTAICLRARSGPLGASDGPRGTSGCRNKCPWGRRRPLRGMRQRVAANGAFQHIRCVGTAGRGRPALRRNAASPAPGSSRPTVVIDADCLSSGLGDGRHRFGGRFLKRPYILGEEQRAGRFQPNSSSAFFRAAAMTWSMS